MTPPRLVLPLAFWPPADRQRWEAAMQRGGSPRFATDGVQLGKARRLAQPTLEKNQEGYGRWLAFLAARGALDAASPPGGRVTEDRLAAYIDELRARGNRDTTVFGRLQELAAALRLLEPGFDTRQILAPGGTPVHGRLDLSPLPVEVHHPRELFHWGLSLMERALTLTGPRRRQVMLRDGLLIALLAGRPFRLGTIVSARIPTNLWREGEQWFIGFAASQVKNGRVLSFPITRTLVPWLKRYLEVERIELLAGAESDALWVNWGGRPLGVRGLEKRVRWRSAKRFGADRTFGPHRFRYGVGTLGPEADPQNPTIGALLLGDSHEVAEKHYRRAETHAAHQRHGALIDRLRAATEPPAASGYGWHEVEVMVEEER